MASAPKPLAPQPVTSAMLRQLWEGGQRGAVIRTALENRDRLIDQRDDLQWLVGVLRSSGLGAEGFAVQLESTRREGQVPAWECFIREVLDTGDPWWARELLAEAGGNSRALAALRIEAESALGDPAPLITAWVRAHHDATALEAAVRWWVRCGRVDEAVRLADEAEALTLWRARFALWRNRPDVARPLLATLAPDPEVRCLEAIAFVLAGDLEQGERVLRELLDSPVRAEAWIWLATVLRKQRRYAAAIRAADAASSASPGFNLVARLERELASDYQRTGRGTTGPESTDVGWLRRVTDFAKRLSGRPRMHRIEELENAHALYPLGLEPRDSIAALEAAIERFAGNHTLQLTTSECGVLRSYPLPENPR